MPHPSHLRKAAELFEITLTGTLPADTQMERYFRQHREMGVRDRGFIIETVYGCLRHKRLLEHLCGEDAPADDLAAAQMLLQGMSARALEQSGYRGDAYTLASRVRTLDRRSLPFAVRANLPDWLAQKLRAQLGDAEALALADALDRPAPVDLRANTLKTDREELRVRLAAEGFDCAPTPYSPVGLRREQRAPLLGTRCFRDGLFEIQDEGSQLLSLLVEPRRHEMVVDFCAGAGGKTLHLGAIMANTGTLYAFDVSTRRLERLKPRLRRAGLDNVRAIGIEHERDDRVRRLHGKIDRVLVDAPCSGTGTLRRNPEFKWRPANLDELVAGQRRILAAAADLVKPGGRLVYATCSLLSEEDEEVVSAFASENPAFARVPIRPILARRKIPLADAGETMRLYPHRHGTDGFYCVVFERTG